VKKNEDHIVRAQEKVKIHTILDTSALLTHFFDEPGAEMVDNIRQSPTAWSHRSISSLNSSTHVEAYEDST
jgi:PIN domain nuclease of toxin-antitoxin system